MATVRNLTADMEEFRLSSSNLWQRRANKMTSIPIADGNNGIMDENQSMANGQRENRESVYEDSSRDGSPYQSQGSKSLSESPTNTPMSEEQNARLIEVANKYGYHLVKENGQRKFYAPADLNLKTPPRGCEVFIGKLPRELYEDELFPLFQQCGTIYEMRMMLDFSGTNRGYAFVTYTNREDAKRACQELNNFEIRRGRHIGVVMSVDNCRLFVGGIPRTRTREEVKVEMSKLTDGVVDVILYPSAADKSKNRGFAFVEYESHKAAAKARRKLLPNRIQLWGNVIAVDWAEPEQEVDEATMANVKVLYVRNLMVHTTEDTLRQAFEAASGTPGSVERVKKMRDFAFVHFNTREQALRARDQLNGSNLDGATIEVCLSKPPYQSNIVRCMKNLQKSGGRTQSVTSNGNDEYMAAAMRQMYAGPAIMNNVLASPTAVAMASPTSLDPNAYSTPLFNMAHTPTAAALTGFPCIDPNANVSQAMMERQNSMGGQMGNGPVKYLGITNYQGQMNGNAPGGGGGRMNRGAAGMRSAGFQAMINNTLRNTAASRRKFSEQFLYDYIASQQQASLQHQQQLAAQQQALLSPPAGVVIIPNGPGLPLWRPTVTSPTGGYVPLLPSTPFVPMPQTTPTSVAVPVSMPAVSEAIPASVSIAIPVSSPAAITTIASSVDDSPPPTAQQLQQSPPVSTSATTLVTGPQYMFNGNGGGVPFTSYQQHLEDFCRDQGLGVPKYELLTMQHADVTGRHVVLYAYKVTIPGLGNGSFQLSKVWPTELDAREAAAQFVCLQLGALMSPTSPMLGTGFEVFGIPQMGPPSPWIPDMMNPFFAFNPLYQQQLRRPMNQQLSVNATASPSPAAV